ncbi:MAG: endonuclease domain-containing protein [Pirellula sp.]|nr:endonuclease domain-containing protein [Pirellula sp.]
MEQPSQNLPLPDHLRRFARELRTRQTNAERLLWGVLPGRRFLDLKFRRQHAVETCILDFYCDALHWSVELDGGQHNSVEGRRDDAARSAALIERGIVVSRYWNHEVLADFEAVLEDLYRTALRLQNR